MKQIKFLITGHPRQGTRSMAALFQLFGFDVQHEKVGEDGISSWMFAVDSISVPYGTLTRADVEPEYLIHVVRHPVQSIYSIINEGYKQPSIYFRRNFVNFKGINIYEEAVDSLIQWTKIIADQSPEVVTRVEDANITIRNWLKTVGYEVEPVKKMPKLGSSNHPILNWEELKSHLRLEYQEKLKEFCEVYNYKIDEPLSL